MSQNLSNKIILLDIDSRELAPGGLGLAFRERVKPISAKLDELYDFAYREKLKLVFSTCCSGKFLKKDSLDYSLFIPIDKEDTAWIKEVNDYRYYYLEKQTTNEPRKNFEGCFCNLMKYNLNALRLFEELEFEEIIAFGNGFNLCVASAVHKLLVANYKVTILEDVIIPSAGVTNNKSLEENKQDAIKKLKEAGANFISFADFKNKYKM